MSFSSQSKKGTPIHIKMLIEGMSCGSCAAHIQNALQQTPEVAQASVNFVLSQGAATLKPGESAAVVKTLMDQVESLGYHARVDVLNTTFLVTGMSCTSCSTYIENQLRGVPGVTKATVNFATSSASAEFLPQVTNVNELMACVTAAGYKPHARNTRSASTKLMEDGDEVGGGYGSTTGKKEEPRDIQENPNEIQISVLEKRAEIRDLTILFCGSLVCTVPLLLLMIMRSSTSGMRTYNNHLASYGLVELILSTPSVFYFGRAYFIKAWRGLCHGVAGMDTLISVGVGGAYIFSIVAYAFLFHGVNLPLYFDTGSSLITFMLLGRLLEAFAKRHTSDALVSLLRLAPTTALVVRVHPKTGAEQVTEVAVSSLKVNDVCRVRAGDKVPVDGVVVDGASELDEAMVTGESLPRPVGVGANVIGGSVNVAATVTVRTMRVGDDTALAQIVRVVQEAQNSKPDIQLLADRISSVFAPIVFAISLLVLILWIILGAAKAYPDHWDPDGWIAFAFKRFISTLVVACPCAMGLATPTAIVVGTGIGAEMGILAKNSTCMELAGKLDCILFDKTGTLTRGKLTVVTSGFFSSTGEIQTVPDPKTVRVLYAVESESTHPIAKALATHCEPLLTSDDAKVKATEITTVPGLGTTAIVGDKKLSIGSLKFLEEKAREPSSMPPAIGNMIRRAEMDCLTIACLVIDGKILAVYLLSDEAKPEARQVVDKLHSDGIRVMMVSGDRQSVAERIGYQLGIPAADVVSECLPAKKSEVVAELQSGHKIIAFVGDGVNDSPALAQADVGIALGTGTDVAIETASAVLMHDSLVDLLTFLKLSRAIVRRIGLNFAWAFCYNVAMIPIAAGVLYPATESDLPPIAAGGAMVLSSISVLISSLALRCFTPETLPPPHYTATSPSKDADGKPPLAIAEKSSTTSLTRRA